MYRVIDKETKVFLRDDFTFDQETEIGLNVEPSQGLIQPKWECRIQKQGVAWVETMIYGVAYYLSRGIMKAEA